MLGLLLLLWVAPNLAQLSLGNLDLEELRDVQYSIQILDVPVSEDGKVDDAMTAMVMVNREGQRYRCSIPKVEEKTADSEGEGEDADPDVETLLKPLETAPCIFKTKDWWTYEICYNREIKQYHVENDRPVGAVMVLGVHSPELDNWEASNRTYQPQYYTNGSNCDLTSRPRQTELRFVCNEAATVEFIGDIFEPQSCEYTIVVHTARLCSVPWLRPEAESTPRPIQCNPLLPSDQFSKYQLYEEKKQVVAKLAEKERKRKQAAVIAAQEGVDQKMVGSAGLMDLMGSNMADRLVGEINTLLGSALAGDKDTGIKVVDLREKDDNIGESPAVEVERYRAAKVAEEATKADKWDLIHSVHKTIEDPELQELVNTRNNLWRKIHEAKKSVKKYTSQLHDTETFIKNEEETTQNNENLDSLEQQKRFIEKALVKAREDVAAQEELAKDVSHKIVAQQNKLRVTEENNWRGKLEVLTEKMETPGSLDRFKEDIEEMAHQYFKATNEKLVKMDDYFKYAKKFVSKEKQENLEVLRNYMQFANENLSLMVKEETEANNEELKEFNKEIESLTEEKKVKVAKFRDIVKDDVREKFSDILKEVSEELRLPDGDVDQEEAINEMSATLDQLITKLAGPTEKVEGIHKHVMNLKKAAEEASEEAVNLKRDGKRSVKKELRDDDDEPSDIKRSVKKELKENSPPPRADIPIEDDDDEDFDVSDDAELDAALEEARKKLLEAEAEVELLEKEWNEKMPSKVTAKSPAENVRVSVTKMGAAGGEQLDEDQAAKIAKRLEGTIKDKLAKLGIDTGNRPIEVKLITTSMPEGLGLGEEGDPQNDQQVQSMFFNMMTGNIQGYEDIDSQRKAENSYKFTWNENMIEELESKIASFGGDIEDAVISEDTGDGPEEITLADDEVPDLIGVDDQRQRPSSKDSKMSDLEDIIFGEEEDEASIKDEL